jgi:protein phosphatase 2C family protein 2/3
MLNFILPFSELLIIKMSNLISPVFLTLRSKPRANSLVDLRNQLKNQEAISLTSKLSPHPRLSSKFDLPLLTKTIRSSPSLSKLKTSSKSYGPIKSFAACTNKGLIRDYNEDRVSIVPRIKINKKDRSVSYFGLFDGHGGAGCADFVAENLHNYLFSALRTTFDIPKALESSSSTLEKAFFTNIFQKTFDNSGSCACSLVFCGNTLFVSNLGDSRALLGCNKGTFVYQLSVDHKPDNPSEKERIEDAGGKIIRNTGISRIFPGRLSVSRAFGDFSAKIKNLGGNPAVLIAKPEIFAFQIDGDFDYCLIGSDGIFDVLSNEDVNFAVWEGFDSPAQDLHEKAGLAARNVVDLAMKKGSSDNVTCIVVLLKNILDY